MTQTPHAHPLICAPVMDMIEGIARRDGTGCPCDGKVEHSSHIPDLDSIVRRILALAARSIRELPSGNLMRKHGNGHSIALEERDDKTLNENPRIYKLGKSDYAPILIQNIIAIQVVEQCRYEQKRLEYVLQRLESSSLPPL